MSEPSSEILVYAEPGGSVWVQARLPEGSVWLRQAQVAELYATKPQNIAQHIRTIYDEAEQVPRACKAHLHVRSVKHYNLAVILAVGFRVRSPAGTRFRQWATEALAEFAVKGFAMEDRRLKAAARDHYFEAVLARIRDIRFCERLFWKNVLDIYATSVDCDPRPPSKDPDSIPDALRLVSGGGRPIRLGVDPGRPFGLKWHGSPSILVEKECWILVTTRQGAYVRDRFCHATNEASAHFEDPPVGREGRVLYTDRYVRFSDPIPVQLPSAPCWRRSRYADRTEARLTAVPPAKGARPSFGWGTRRHAAFDPAPAKPGAMRLRDVLRCRCDAVTPIGPTRWGRLPRDAGVTAWRSG